MSRPRQVGPQTRRSVLRGVAVGAMSLVAVGAATPTVIASREYPESEDESDYDWELFTTEELGTIELRVHEEFADLGPDLLRCARWAQEITQEYRPLDYTGLSRIWLYPPDGDALDEEIGISGNIGLAFGGGDVMDIYMKHPPEDTIDDILSASDPRLEDLFFRTLMHEYIHAESYWMMFGFPGWFEHGFTEFTTKNHHQSYYETVKADIENDELMTLDEVDETTGGYTYGLFVMKYLVQEYGMEAVGQIYQEMAENYEDHGDVETEAAFEEVLGIPFDEFESEFRETVRDWFSDIDDIPSTIDGRIIHPDDYFVRERGEVGIDIGSPPSVDYTTDDDADADTDDDDEDTDDDADADTNDDDSEDAEGAEKREELEEIKQTIEALEVDLERKNETIAEHEERVAALEQQLEDNETDTQEEPSPDGDNRGTQVALGAGGMITGGGLVYAISKYTELLD